ncbi:YfcC family protein [Sporolituus thermophilus]|uniref:Uncharacterized membrane protein YfcC, ion transporter superfamily n=1 Tax=Sporolituus thermophilus DSM 23256 TaxID=1123285 RepID=A0A1G7PAA7_9FIRM|nr:YfcC family protein [Sporolituus thermophilus]SDF83144.1 Uncharacterized membrane protein YfcC, ion transporter superfamily [Sporolituus thermophilus DSM 23256]
MTDKVLPTQSGNIAPKPEKKQSEELHVYALMFGFVVLLAALTWIIPAGEYQRVKQGGMTKVVAGTFHTVPANPQGIFDIFAAVVKGWEQAANLIFMIFFIGAAIKILEETGVIGAGMTRLVSNLKGKEMYALAIVTLITSFGGAIGVLANSVVALMPLGLMLSKALGYDEAVGLGMIYLGAYAGFNVGWANVSTVGIAQSIAELPLFSGLWMRVFFHLFNVVIIIAFLYLYCKQIKQDPTKSLTYGLDRPAASTINGFGEVGEFTLRHKLVTLIVLVGFGAIIYGSMKLNWGISHFSIAFLMMGVAGGLTGGLGVNGTCKAFVRGLNSIVFAACVVGMARAISVVMVEGKIIDTIVHYLSLPIGSMGPVLGANMMYVVNIIVNFIIPSGSGQAVTVMPLMVPLADLTGITRQVAVQAFQFGDGFANCIAPTAGTLMACLGIAGIPFDRYAKWFLPVLAVQLLLGAVAITVLQMIGWQG